MTQLYFLENCKWTEDGKLRTARQYSIHSVGDDAIAEKAIATGAALPEASPRAMALRQTQGNLYGTPHSAGLCISLDSLQPDEKIAELRANVDSRVVIRIKDMEHLYNLAADASNFG
jgi:hypothetical protein